MFKSKQILIKSVVEGKLEYNRYLLTRRSFSEDPIIQIRYLLDCLQEIAYLFPPVFYRNHKWYYHEAFLVLNHFIKTELVIAIKIVIEKGKVRKIFKPELNGGLIYDLYI